MILLDTNIVSAVMAPGPPSAVIEWLNGQDALTLYLSTDRLRRSQARTIAQSQLAIPVISKNAELELVNPFDAGT